MLIRTHALYGVSVVRSTFSFGVWFPGRWRVPFHFPINGKKNVLPANWRPRWSRRHCRLPFPQRSAVAGAHLFFTSRNRSTQRSSGFNWRCSRHLKHSIWLKRIWMFLLTQPKMTSPTLSALPANAAVFQGFWRAPPMVIRRNNTMTPSQQVFIIRIIIPLCIFKNPGKHRSSVSLLFLSFPAANQLAQF